MTAVKAPGPSGQVASVPGYGRTTTALHLPAGQRVAAVIPIESLLHRIRWDEAFGRADFTVGYFDRACHAVVSVPFERIRIEHGNHFAFTATEPDGSLHEVPFHRVREVRRNGEVIWQRRVASDSLRGGVRDA